MIDNFYGDSMSGKSTALEVLAGHIYETTGKKTQVWIGDGGADTYNRRGLVDDGVIEIADFSFRHHPLTMLKLMSELYWPKDSKDPKSLLVAPPVDLFDKVGLRIYEGGAVIGSWMLSDIPGGMAWHGANRTGFAGVKDEDQELFYKDAVSGYGDEFSKQGATSGKHYALVQRKILAAVRASKQFPGLTVWTSHPVLAPDKTEGGSSGQFGKIDGVKIYGPDFGGAAPASTIGKEFGNTIHFDLVNVETKEIDPDTKKPYFKLDRKYRAYTRRHVDPNGTVKTEYLAGNRIGDPTLMPDYLTSKDPGDSILQFYQKMKDAIQKTREKKNNG